MKMEKENYLRLALVLGDSGATSVRTNLLKMISLLLVDVYPNSMTIQEMNEKLKEKYGLTFDYKEIYAALSHRKNKDIYLTKINANVLNNSYLLSPEAKEKYSKKLDSKDIRYYIDKFKKATNSSYSIFKYEELIIRFLFEVFNTNTAYLNNLVKQSISTEIIDEYSFSQDDKILINQFLQWENDEKNEFIYKLVGCAYEYFILSTQWNENSKLIFKNKVFYLDANVIFRLYGLDEESRKITINSFIKKCQEAEITLAYTNWTQDEIERLIDSLIRQLKTKFNGKPPISIENMERYNADFGNIDFYTLYYNWCGIKGNHYKDYEKFKSDVKYDIAKLLQGFKKVSFSSYEGKENFDQNVNSLREFKRNANRKFTEDSLIVDINNFLYLESINEGEDDNFLGSNNYLISADHVLVRWNKERFPGTTPIIVLPSVWHTILLKYCSRSQDDLYSFSKFLSFNIGYSDNNINKDYLCSIFNNVLNYNLSAERKDEVLHRINVKLRNSEEEIIPVEDLVEETVQDLIDEEKEGWSRSHSEENKTLKDEIARIEASKQKIEYELEQTRKELNKHQEEEKRKEKEKIEREHEFELNKKVKKRKNKYLLLLIVVFFLTCIVFVAMLQQYKETDYGVFIASVFVAFIAWMGKEFYQKVLHGFDDEEIKKIIIREEETNI